MPLQVRVLPPQPTVTDAEAQELRASMCNLTSTLIELALQQLTHDDRKRVLIAAWRKTVKPGLEGL